MPLCNLFHDVSCKNSPNDRTRTCDLVIPNHACYQTALRPDKKCGLCPRPLWIIQVRHMNGHTLLNESMYEKPVNCTYVNLANLLLQTFCNSMPEVSIPALDTDICCIPFCEPMSSSRLMQPVYYYQSLRYWFTAANVIFFIDLKKLVVAIIDRAPEFPR